MKWRRTMIDFAMCVHGCVCHTGLAVTWASVQSVNERGGRRRSEGKRRRMRRDLRRSDRGGGEVIHLEMHGVTSIAASYMIVPCRKFWVAWVIAVKKLVSFFFAPFLFFLLLPPPLFLSLSLSLSMLFSPSSLLFYLASLPLSFLPDDKRS